MLRSGMIWRQKWNVIESPELKPLHFPVILMIREFPNSSPSPS